MSAVSGPAKISMCLLIVGNLVGAGILAMPVEIGIAGMVPALIGIVLVGAAMLLTGLTLAREATAARDDGFNYPSLYARYLGSIGKWLAVSANILILYGMMVAYLAGGAAVLAECFGGLGYEKLALIVFFLAMVTLVLGGETLISRSNFLMVIVMWIAFVLIVVVGFDHVRSERYGHLDWSFFPYTFPVVVTAFWFHNIIPNVCRILAWDFRTVARVMIVALVVGGVMYLTWTASVLGAVPADGPNGLIAAYRQQLPATVPLGFVAHSPLLRWSAPLFALAAIATSYVSTSLGTISFNEDFFRQFSLKPAPWTIRLCSLVPSFVVALLFPKIFIRAVDLVGGIGISLLFGFLPAVIGVIIARRQRRPAVKIGYGVVMSGFVLLIAWQVLVEFGIIKPTV